MALLLKCYEQHETRLSVIECLMVMLTDALVGTTHIDLVRYGNN